MAEKEFEQDDPFNLNGMVFELPKQEAERAEEEMAACFIEEYARLGYTEDVIFALFSNPFYQGTHVILKSRGEKYVRGLIREVCGQEEEGPNG